MSSGREEDRDGWISALQYIRMLESTWKATVTVEVITDGANYAQTCFVKVKATVPALVTPGKVYQVEKYDRWPRNDYKTVGGLVYYLCHQLDHEIGVNLYKQQELPF